MTTVEHLDTQQTRPERANDYRNCLYACSWCNRARSNRPRRNGKGARLLNPVTSVWAKHYGGGERGHVTPGSPAQLPLGTVTTRDHNALIATWLTKFYGTAEAGTSMLAPVPTLLAGGGRGGGHVAKVAAFLTKYYSGGEGAADSQQQSLFAPLHTVTTRDRFGLVEIYGDVYEFRDIGMRMLQPHELFRAQGFPEDWDITCERILGRPLKKGEQTALAGNSVPPQLSEALAAANINGSWRAAA